MSLDAMRRVAAEMQAESSRLRDGFTPLAKRLRDWAERLQTAVGETERAHKEELRRE